MNNSALPKLALLALLLSACSVIVNADRSKVHDDLYQPSIFPDAGESPDAAGDTGGGAGAAGASAEAGAAGAITEEGGAAGTTASAGAGG